MTSNGPRLLVKIWEDRGEIVKVKTSDGRVFGRPGTKNVSSRPTRIVKFFDHEEFNLFIMSILQPETEKDFPKLAVATMAIMVFVIAPIVAGAIGGLVTTYIKG